MSNLKIGLDYIKNNLGMNYSGKLFFETNSLH